MDKGRKRKKKNDLNRNCQDIRSFFRPIPKIERTESIESSRLSAVQEAPSPPDDDDDGFFVAAPHIVNSPPKLSPIPLIEDTPPPSPETNRIQSPSPKLQRNRDDSSTESDSDSDSDESVKSLPALQFRFDLASLNEGDLPELEPIEFKNDSDDDMTEMFRSPSDGELLPNNSSFSSP